MSPPPRDEDDLLAAELAFGLLDGAERADAHARRGGDAAFADLCGRWQERASLLAAGIEEAPRPSLWTGITAELGWRQPAARSSAGWRIATALSALAAAILLVVAVRAPRFAPAPAPVPRVQPARPLVAVLTGKDTAAVVAVSVGEGGRRLAVTPHALTLPGRVPELWVIANGAKPAAVGVVPAGRRSVATPPPSAIPAFAPGATLAISVEPVGGSPTGQPTGPVILTGILAAS